MSDCCPFLNRSLGNFLARCGSWYSVRLCGLPIIVNICKYLSKIFNVDAKIFYSVYKGAYMVLIHEMKLQTWKITCYCLFNSNAEA
jgi:hypothetical protein